MMPSRDEVQIVLNVLGQEGLESLRKSTEHYKRLMEELAEQFKRGDLAADEWIKQHGRMSLELAREEEMLARLIGKPGGGGGGQGLLGASYAAQDFISVLSGGGGLGRALGAVSNNVPQLLTALGAGAGLAGVFSVVTAVVAAGIPILEKWWGAAGDPEALEKAKKAVEDFRQAAKSAHDEFQKLTSTPTDREKQSAGLTREFLEMPGTAEKVRSGLVATMGERSGMAGMSAEERQEYGALGAELLSDEGIERAGAQAAMAASRSGAPPAAAQAARSEAMARARRARDRARDRRDALLRAGKGRQAEGLIAGMTRAGAEGSAARGEVMRRIGEDPDAFPANTGEHLGGLMPSALAAQDDEIAEEEERTRRAGEYVRRRAEERREAKRKQDADRRLGEALTRQGELYEREGREDLERERQKEARNMPTPQERAVAGQIQAAYRANTGQNLSDENALAAARRTIDENNRAQQEAAMAFAGAMGGMQQSTQVWRGLTARLQRGVEQSQMPSGLQR